MANRYTTREAVKAAAGIIGSDGDVAIDSLIDSYSRAVDLATHTHFIPLVETRKYDAHGPALRGRKLYFDAHLQSISAFTDQGDEAVAVAASEYRLMPQNDGPPYSWLELLSDVTTAQLQSDPDTLQDSFRITGSWSAHSETVAASSIITGNMDDSQTTLHVANGSKVGVGDTVLIQSEQMFVSDRDDVDLAVNTHGSTGAMGADDSDTTVTLAGVPTDAVNVGEVLRIGTELLLVTAINSTTSFEVERAHDGSILAAHSTGDDVFIRRTYTIVRAVNGTTAATHADDLAVTRYVVPTFLRLLVEAEVIAAFYQQPAGWGRSIGSGEGQRELSGRALDTLRKRGLGAHKRHLMASF